VATTTTKRVSGAASGGQTARVQGTPAGGQTKRIAETTGISGISFLLLEGDMQTGGADALLLEGDEDGHLLLEGDEVSLTDATIITKRVTF
jgi:hypothetical protein